MYTQETSTNSNRAALFVLFFCLSMLFRLSVPGQTVNNQVISAHQELKSNTIKSVSPQEKLWCCREE
jgi:hypothetical protein